MGILDGIFDRIEFFLLLFLMFLQNFISYILQLLLLSNVQQFLSNLQFRKKMNNIGIETGIHYRPVHTFSMYKTNRHLPITEKAGNEIVSIPMHPNLSDDEISKIINAVNKFC